MDAPFDRGEVDRASLDATERLRLRLSGQRPSTPEPRRRSVLPWVIAGSLFVFTAGMIANPWFESNVRNKLPFVEATTTADQAQVKAVEARLAQLESRAGSPTAPMPVERLARTEAKIETSTDQIARETDRIDRLTSEVAALGAAMRTDHARADAVFTTAAAAADRAQAMLVVVLARRAVDAGRPFGALDQVLHQSFEARYPAAVKAVSALGAAPVTLASLRRDFDAMRPAITSHPIKTRLNWWEALTTKLSSVVESSSNEAAADAVALAALQRGDTAAAAGHLRRLPGPHPAALTNWLAAADRLQAGSQGLATLENGVLMPPVSADPHNAPAPAAAAQTAHKAPSTSATIHSHVAMLQPFGDALRRVFDMRGIANQLR